MENLINQLKELQGNYDMGLNTQNEFYNQSIDVILRETSLPCARGEQFKVDIEKFEKFIGKLIS